MKTVMRLVTEDPVLKDKKGDPKWVYNDYMATSVITINNLQKPASEALVGDTIDKGNVIKVVSFQYEDHETPAVAA